MNALRRVRGEITIERVRVAGATALVGLLAAILVSPMCSDACWHGDGRLAADPNVSRLIQAIMEMNVPEARRLLDRGALDLNALGKLGMTPLAHAIAVRGHPVGESLATLVLEHGADVNQPDRYGHTPLMWSFSVGDPGVTGMLLRGGADVHARRRDGSTVLHIAAHSEAAPGTVRLLLAAGADPTVRDAEGKTAGDYAREAGLTELAQLLDAPVPVSAGAEPLCIDCAGVGQ